MDATAYMSRLVYGRKRRESNTTFECKGISGRIEKKEGILCNSYGLLANKSTS